MKHVLPRLLRPEAPGGTWTSGKTGRGRKEVRRDGETHEWSLTEVIEV